MRVTDSHTASGPSCDHPVRIFTVKSITASVLQHNMTVEQKPNSIDNIYMHQVWTLTTKVRRHSVLAGARGSKAACKSHTLILLQSETHHSKTHKSCDPLRKKKGEAERSLKWSLTHRKRHWQSSCYQSGCNAPVLHDPPALANMPRTQCPITCKNDFTLLNDKIGS